MLNLCFQRDSLLIDLEGTGRTSYETDDTVNFTSDQILSRHDQVIRGSLSKVIQSHANLFI